MLELPGGGRCDYDIEDVRFFRRTDVRKEWYFSSDEEMANAHSDRVRLGTVSKESQRQWGVLLMDRNVLSFSCSTSRLRL